ncbi:hypothetical protein [Neobacillus sp. NPDC093127]|uniref:hypothetical protein n=1 Tax=Neobacillus sp. NPDC093127 TaxID=3364296 RepID=UPI00380746AE
MNVRALIDCVGLDYDLKAGDTANLKKDTAEKLITFGYVEKEKVEKEVEKEVEKVEKEVEKEVEKVEKEEEKKPKETRAKE